MALTTLALPFLCLSPLSSAILSSPPLPHNEQGRRERGEARDRQPSVTSIHGVVQTTCSSECDDTRTGSLRDRISSYRVFVSIAKFTTIIAPLPLLALLLLLLLLLLNHTKTT